MSYANVVATVVIFIALGGSSYAVMRVTGKNVVDNSLTGADIMASHLWKLELPAEWKLKPGEKWEGAQESVRPEEEINAQAQNAPKKK